MRDFSHWEHCRSQGDGSNTTVAKRDQSMHWVTRNPISGKFTGYFNEGHQLQDANGIRFFDTLEEAMAAVDDAVAAQKKHKVSDQWSRLPPSASNPAVASRDNGAHWVEKNFTTGKYFGSVDHGRLIVDAAQKIQFFDSAEEAMAAVDQLLLQRQLQGPKTRRERRAMRSARGKMKLIEGGKEVAEDTPAQRFGEDLEAHIADYLKKHSGLDKLNVTKVVMQLSAKMAIDHSASEEEYVNATRFVFQEIAKSK